MELKDLNEEERVALVALLREVIAADRAGGDSKGENLAGIVAALGDTAYERALDTAQSRFEDVADLKKFLETIRVQDAREMIFATVMDLSITDTVLPQEAQILDWLAAVWGIEVKPLSTT